MEPLFLGLDLSTQGLKAVLVQEDCSIVHESTVHFDRDLPGYGTINGAIRGLEGEVASPVEMWLEAYDLIMTRMKAAGVDFSAISAISGDGQQHGSVYWSHDAGALLANLNASKNLSSQLCPKAFSLQKAPIWQDFSTTRECRELEDAVGGAQALTDISGSRAYERFTGSQISKIRRSNNAVYDATSRVSLVSSFMPSLFLGKIAPIEISDASGMNLMEILSCKWDDRLIGACGGPELHAKLGPEPVAGGTTLGTVSPYWVERWGFSAHCIIAPFTGDNSATVVALSFPGDALLSLGTSTTYLLSIPPSLTPPKRFTTSHLLAHPTTAPDAQIAMLCYKNGALAREQVRDRYTGGHWSKYNELVEAAPPGCNGYMGLYFPLPEIIPPGVKGEFFYQISGPNAPVRLAESQVPAGLHPRMILESQFLSIRSRITAILPPNAPRLSRLVVSGGSSGNQTIRQLAADLFDMKVYISATKEAAAMGGALLARFAWWKATAAPYGTFEEMCSGIDAAAFGMKCVAIPNPDTALVYSELVGSYVACEGAVVDASGMRGL
ncbi:actin-like ATPase domain-containing protein [Guyanagaster necrorhizus]|uniref:Xylulose kinase n=1 Tax=Guyanagaster necrorhizus TaxID=856835 RepID=A0A9P8ARH1_9AGAR|nr:actin-like ATPase domain-containing protein [Guyanagaster necrorhizus MCA 3950]KAG7444891.1 actin-like ATPase domain-containing protein [Guyanagaster necrorhizus MCA 3950]